MSRVDIPQMPCIDRPDLTMPRATPDRSQDEARPAPSRQLRATVRPPADASRPGRRAAALGALSLSLWLGGCVHLGAPAAAEVPEGDDDGAALAAADCGGPDLPRQALAKLNDYRAAGARCGTAGRFTGSPALRWQPPLARAAAAHLDEQVALGRLSHASTDGRGLTQRLDAVGYPWQAAAENLAAGQATLELLLLDWMRSPSHCANLMNPAYQDAALACRRADDGRLYWALVLGRPRPAPPATVAGTVTPSAPASAAASQTRPVQLAPAASASRPPVDPSP